jgi:hypothetical protein
MYDVNDDAKGGFRRIEILTGPGRRRRWSPEEKGRIVAETLEPGAQVAAVRSRFWFLCARPPTRAREVIGVPAMNSGDNPGCVLATFPSSRYRGPCPLFSPSRRRCHLTTSPRS